MTGAGPLQGIRVLELGSFIAGPFAGQLLGDYGADVIKVEPPGSGDPMRQWGVTRDGESLWWPAIARNKRSVTVDLRTEEGRATVLRLAAECDVVLENFRPGKLAEWGLVYSSIAAVNPGVVMVHVSGFGQTGPRASEAGFGSIGEAVGGIRFVTGDPDGRPSRAGVSLGDSLASLFAVVGALAALVERQHSGRGQEVDVAIYEAVAALMESAMSDYEQGGVLRSRSGSILPGVAPSNVYRSADGVDIVLAANADGVFRRLCAAMGSPALADDERFSTHAARGRNMAQLDELIQAWISAFEAEDVLSLLAGRGVPAGKINSAADMLADPQFAARQMVLRPEAAGRPVGPMIGVVPKFGRTPGGVRSTGPALGAHTDEVLRQLAQDGATVAGIVANHTGNGTAPRADGHEEAEAVGGPTRAELREQS